MKHSHTEPWPPASTIQIVLTYAHVLSPIILLVVFLFAFVWHSIAISTTVESLEPLQLGPGGKPLPRGLSSSAKAKKATEMVDYSPGRKYLFTWFSALILLSFIGNAILVIVETLKKRSENWWCGEAFVVSEQSLTRSRV